MFTEQLERIDLAGELDTDPTDLAGVLAAAFQEMLDGYLGQRRRLRRRQPVDRGRRFAAAQKSPDDVRHVGAGHLSELLQHLLGRHYRALGCGLRELSDAEPMRGAPGAQAQASAMPRIPNS